ncbi:protein GUCD1 isoform X1 [Schistocerca gregaria]|uniref:protein GUCD1 isoform X1 n=1 Tax=Schistocerca gregaria TaxID=7010 RepID=UPI00211E2A9F|nr:protein GUCD1 isoform X1 [Schistocerca gregaria]
MESVASDRIKGLPPVFERKVVHQRQRFYWDCGVSCVLMVLPCDGYQHFLANFNEICKEEDFNKSTWTIDLCYLLRRYDVKHLFCTVTMGVHPEYKGQAFYEKVIKNDEERVNKKFADAEEYGIDIKKTSLTCSDLINHIFQFGPVILLTNASLLTCTNCKCRKFTNELLSCLPWPTAYAGHYIVLVGYNLLKQLFYYRNPTYKDRVCAIPFTTLNNARLSYGTDEDAILVYSSNL